MQIQTILFPTDFSEGANAALKQAIYFSKLTSARLIIFHVYHRPVKEELFRNLKEKEKDIELKYDTLKKACPELSEIKYSFQTELGISTDAIVEMGREGKVDMIIMATKGARGFGELWGTKTASIIERVDLPVIVIPNNSSLENINTIGLAYDYSKESPIKSLSYLAYLSEVLKADLAIITVSMREKELTEEKKAIREQMMRRLEDIPYSFNYSHHEDVEEGLITYCKQNEIGLLCIVPHTYNFIKELFHESLTQKMVFHSAIPLLVI